jgi:basic amino acid/polyamine antiporter, APA family
MALKRELGLAAAIAAVCGESIALGIFLTPAAMAKSLGSPALLLAVWLAMAVMAMAGAICYAKLAVHLPEAGGLYVYLRHFYGERVGFLYGWMSIAVMDSGIATALAVGAAGYVGGILPAASTHQLLTATALLAFMAALHYRGIHVGGQFMAITNWLKLGLIAVLIIWSVVAGKGSTGNLLPFATRRLGSDALAMGIAGAFINAFFSYGGWWDVTKLAGEIRDPEKNLPRAMLFGVGAVTVVYIGLSAAFLYVVPLERVTSNQAFVFQFGEALFGHAGSIILSICVLISVVGGLTALTMASPRVTYAMALNGNFFSPFARLHPRFNSPANAILLQLACSLTLLGLGAFDRIISYIIFSAIVFLALTAAAVFRLPQEQRRGPWFPIAPVLFIFCCGTVALMILLRNPLSALLGVLVVLAGNPLHWRLKMKASDSAHTLLAAE